MEKTMDKVLQGSRSPTSMSIRLLAQMVDFKFESLEKENTQRHTEVMSAVKSIEEKFDSKFNGLEIVSFFSRHKKLFWIVVSSVLILIGSSIPQILTNLMK